MAFLRVSLNGRGTSWHREVSTRPCASKGLSKWALNRWFQDFFWIRFFFVVLSAGLGVSDALVEGKGGGSFRSVMVHSVHRNIVPHIATRCGLFGGDVGP